MEYRIVPTLKQLSVNIKKRYTYVKRGCYLSGLYGILSKKKLIQTVISRSFDLWHSPFNNDTTGN